MEQSLKSLGQDAWTKRTVITTDKDFLNPWSFSFLLSTQFEVSPVSVPQSKQRHPEHGRLCGLVQGHTVLKEWTRNLHLSHGLLITHFPHDLQVLSVF